MDLSTEKISGEIYTAGLPQHFFKVVRWGGGQQKESYIICGQLGREGAGQDAHGSCLQLLTERANRSGKRPVIPSLR